MFSLYDMMGGPNGGAFEDMAGRFGLSRAQIEAAVAALLPAYAEGLRRSFADPAAMAAMARAWQASPMFANSGAGLDAATAMFGGPQIRAAVVEQAAKASGVSGEVMRELLPPLTASLMSGMLTAFGAALKDPGTGSASAKAGDPWTTYFTEFMKAATPSPRSQARAPEPPPAAEPPPSAEPTGEAPDMLALGREMSEQHTRNMQAIFEAFLGPKKKPGG